MPDREVSPKKLLEALAKSPALVAVLRGPTHIYEYVNDRYHAAVDLGDPVGKPFGASGHGTTPALVALLNRVYATGEPYEGRELPVPRHNPDGTLDERYFNVSFIPLHDADGHAEGVLIHSYDVTELVRARQHVAEKQARLRRLFEAGIVGIGFWTLDGHISEANDEFLRISGYTRQDLAAGLVSWRGMTPPEYMEVTAAALKDFAAHGSFEPFEKEYVRKNGERVWVLLGGAALDETRTSGVAFVLDLTARKRAEREHAALQEKMVEVQRLESLGVLAGGIAHDFNNLLAAVLGSVSAAAFTVARDDPAQPALRDALLALRRASDLTRQLLAYSGKGELQMRIVDLSAQVRELTGLLETSLPKKAHLELALAPGLPAILADVAQLQQIVMNLVINGAEAIAEPRGTVRVTTSVQSFERSPPKVVAPGELAPGRYVVLEVSDTGVGMDDGTRARIFDPFFTTKVSGRGLGLAAVLGIVRGHRGAVSVASSPGRGTTFSVFFPATAHPAPSPRRGDLAQYHGSGVVLVVDDDSGVRRAMRRLLEVFGFEVLEAENGRVALERFASRAGDVRLVVLDMSMPELGGEETFKELRRMRPDLCVVLSSGYDETQAAARFRTDGLAAFLQKPFTSDELARCLEKVLGPGA